MKTGRKAFSKEAVLRSLLAVVFLYAMLSQARRTWEVVEALTGREDTFELPVVMKGPAREVAVARQEAGAAGIRGGDQILALNSTPFEGHQALKAFRSRDAIVKIRRGQETMDVRVRLLRVSERSRLPGTRVVMTVLGILMPWLCILLGFWAVLIHPTDRQAWLLLLLMVTFPHLVTRPPWEENVGLRIVLSVTHEIFHGVVGVVMLLFGIYFAERFSLDQRLPWMKWIVIVPAAASGLASAALNAAAAENLVLAERLTPVLGPAAAAAGWMLMLCIGLFFACLGMKAGTSRSADVRRRLKLLLWGGAVSLTPAVAVVLAARVLAKPFDLVLPAWSFFIALVITSLFPLTVTYVVVVHKALDLRVVIRQGIQYALARSGAHLTFLLLGAVVFFAAMDLALEEGLSRPQRMLLVGLGVATIVILQRVRARVASWVDRRFFRQAYSAERVLTELTEDLRTLVEVPKLLKTVTERIAETLFVQRVVFLLDGSGAFHPAYAVGYESPPSVAFPAGGSTARRLREAPQPALVYLDDEESWINSDGMETERELLKRIDAQLVLPVAVKEKLLGFISLGPKQSEEPYSASDLRMLGLVAAQTAMALENSLLAEEVAAEAANRERLNRELEIARQVQERLFPQKIPQPEGYELAGACRPARSVGGDYYDFLTLEDGRVVFVQADVSGKGVGPALLMASLQAMVRSLVHRADQPLAEAVTTINTLLYQSSTASHYATMFVAVLDPASRMLTYCNAGHNPPAILRSTNGGWEILRLEEGGAVVGLLPRYQYKAAQVELRRGDLLIAFTDGISEAQNAQYEEWGEERMMAAAKEAGEMTSEEIISYLMARADEFVAGAHQHDDMTLVVLRVK